MLHLLEAVRYREYLERTVDDQQDNSPLANVDELVTAAVEFDRQHPEDGSLEEFLEQIALVSSTDDWEDNTDRVTLMTLHASKGLEFPAVFIIGVEDDSIPHFRSKEDDAQLEEERRLLFVGITRAQEKLQLSYCKRRLVRGENRPVIASPFLIELPREDLRYVEPEAVEDYFDDDPFGSQDYPDSWDLPDADPSTGDDEFCQLDDEDRVSTTKVQAAFKAMPASVRTAAQMAAKLPPGGVGAFRPGQLVYHPKYGDGTIATMTGRGPKCTVTVAFDEGETKTFRLAFAELEPR